MTTPRPQPRGLGAAMDYDVIVAGVGGMGSATLAELAARGARVLGLERAGLPNDRAPRTASTASSAWPT